MTDNPAPATRLERLADQIDSLPEFWRPVAYGASFVLLWMGMRGAMFLVPIALIYVLFTSQTPLADITKGVIVVALAMLGGALSGFAYSLFGRRLRTIPRIGKYLAGMVTLAPYMMVLNYIIVFTKGQTLTDLPSRGYLVVTTLMTVFFGIVMGNSWFAD